MIYITGDTHRNTDLAKLNSKNFRAGNKLTKSDYVIICGDFGGIWYGNTDDEAIIQWYDDRPWTTLFIDGNHENHYLLNQYPVKYWNGGKVHQISDSVLHLMRGQVFQIQGKSFFTMGGGRSVDKTYRKEGISWWKEEMPSLEEMQEAVDNLEKQKWNVDYVITHSFPTDIVNYFGMEGDTLTNFFTHLEFDFSLTFKRWFSGHYHKDLKIDKFHYMVYQDIHCIK